MPVNLPIPPDERLERSPLALVVWQLRYDPQPRLGSLDVGLAVHGRLGGKQGPLPSMEQVQGGNVSFQFGPEVSASQSVQPIGWRMMSTDLATAAAFHTDALTIETTAYGRWQDDFRNRISEALSALVDVVGPVAEHRLGLRYVDQIGGLGMAGPSSWNGWLKPWALGPANDADLKDSVRATETISVFEHEDGAKARIRVASFPDGDEHVAVFDSDVSRDGNRPLDAADILAASDRFHLVSKQLFYAALEPRLYDHLKGNS